MNINEIKSWAKKHGFPVKKQGEGYVWSGPAGESAPMPIEQVATDVFNAITGGKFIEHQRSFRGIGTTSKQQPSDG